MVTQKSEENVWLSNKTWPLHSCNFHSHLPYQQTSRSLQDDEMFYKLLWVCVVQDPNIENSLFIFYVFL